MALGVIVAATLTGASAVAGADGLALKLQATVVVAPNEGPMSIELNRWSTDAERSPLLAALAAPAPAPAQARGSALPAGGPGRAGRAGRGGARGGAAAPADPLARLTGAIKAAPTVGYLWSGGITGYSIKYAWRAAVADGERIVLVTDRRLGANSPAWSAPSAGTAEPDFTVLELRLNAKGTGEAKSSLNAAVVIDDSAKTLALDKYPTVATLLKVTQ